MVLMECVIGFKLAGTGVNSPGVDFKYFAEYECGVSGEWDPLISQFRCEREFCCSYEISPVICVCLKAPEVRNLLSSQ